MTDRSPEAQKVHDELRAFVNDLCQRHHRHVTMSEYLEVVAKVMTDELRFAAEVGASQPAYAGFKQTA